MKQPAFEQPLTAPADLQGASAGEVGALSSIYLGRQPIIDRDRNLVAFELLFRAGNMQHAQIECDFSATAGVIVNAFTHLGLRQTLGPHRGFINVDRDLLTSDLVDVLPPNQIVLELLETVPADDTVIQRCSELRRAGYDLALDDVCVLDARVRKLLPVASMVKVDLLNMRSELLPELVSALKHLPLLLVAEKVDSHEQAGRCQALGFDLFQGYHFARPEVVTGKRADPSKLGLLRVLKLLSCDAELAEIEDELKQYPDLVYNLMRIVNSAASGFTKKIDSLTRCIVVLGRNKLQRWVQLLLYNAGRGRGRNMSPLMHTAATRGKWMESLAAVERAADKNYQDRAFMVGILSLLESLIGVPMEEMTDDLNLDDDVKDALLSRSGPLGFLLDLIEKKEADDVVAVARALRGIPFLGPHEFMAAELDAMTWANAISFA